MTRLPFVLADLEQEIRAICGDDVKIIMAIGETESYRKVKAALESHNGVPFADYLVKVGGIQILDEIET